VAKLAEGFASVFGAGEWGRLIGLWHDLGKYSPDFQRRLEGESLRVVHAEAGGHLACLKQWPGADKVLAWPIVGHHAGLADFSPAQSGAKALEPKLREPNRSTEVLKQVPSPILNQECPAVPAMFSNRELFPDTAFFIRMLYSCLVDADFLDTEAFMNPERRKHRNPEMPDLESLSAAFDQHMAKFDSSSGKVNECRSQVLKQCRAAADKQGVFSLTVPTGGGKTLSSLAFALHHAVSHGKRRIIYVIPYTSIIEQTAAVFRDIPGFADAVIEHHSNLVWDDGREEENRRKRLAMENWDAPLVVTTSVQFFESLYANRSSRCRKLHNIADSVVIFDEAQCLPPEFLRPCVYATRELSRHYGVTPVLCTATQPILDKRTSFDFAFKEGFESIQEIIEEPDLLSRKLERVRVERLNDLKPVSIADIAERLLSENQSLLCSVNRKSDAR
jgi:CRISPR-associated endonuclease/helicase Cas3